MLINSKIGILKNNIIANIIVLHFNIVFFLYIKVVNVNVNL